MSEASHKKHTPAEYDRARQNYTDALVAGRLATRIVSVHGTEEVVPARYDGGIAPSKLVRIRRKEDLTRGALQRDLIRASMTPERGYTKADLKAVEAENATQDKKAAEALKIAEAYARQPGAMDRLHQKALDENKDY